MINLNDLYNTKTKNPVALAAHELGGQKRFAKLIEVYGISIHKQSIYQWTCKGYIPAKFERAIRLIVESHGRLLSNPTGLLQSVKKAGTPNSPTNFPNKELTEWVESKGGISAFVKEVNELIKSQNESMGFSQKQWTYAMVHNWLKRGQVSTNFQSSMEALGCPKTAQETPLTAKDLLGE